MDELNNVEVNNEVAENKSKKPLVALICGIIGLISCCFPVGIVGVIFGIMGIKEINESGAEVGKGMAIAGIITGALGLLASIIFIIAIVGGALSLNELTSGAFDDIYYFLF